ncbi:MAG: hypothetical protein ACOCXA_06845 [Planctomycetota bacterium]
MWRAPDDFDHAALLQNIAHGVSSQEHGFHDWRGIRTARHTYVIDHDGPWLCYDNHLDPWQQRNLMAIPAYAGLRARLHRQLQRRLDGLGDDFATGREFDERWGYIRNARGLVVDFRDRSRQVPDVPEHAAS